MPVYRYKRTGINVNEIKGQVPPADASSVSLGDIASTVVLDINALATSKDDLDDFMDAQGWAFDSTDPSSTVEEQASGDIVHQDLSGAGTNTHAQIDTHVASTSNPHSVTFSQVNASPIIYDAIVAPSGGDYTLPSAAFSAGAKSVLIRSGTYVETADVVIPDGGRLLGEDIATIDLSGGYSVTIDGNGGTIETTGTIAATTDSTAVVGTGTTFTNLSPGDYIAINSCFYEIASITDNTNLTLSYAYRGESVSGVAMFGTSMFTSCAISRVRITGATGTGLLIRGVSSVVVESVTCYDNVSNLVVTDCGGMVLHGVVSVHGGGTGVTVTRCRTVGFTSCIFSNNDGDGIVVTTGCHTVKLEGSAFCNNDGDGLSIEGDASDTLVTDSIANYNDAKGFNTEPTSSYTVIASCLAKSNGTIGVDFDGGENVIADCAISDNGTDGIWTGDSGIVSGCHVTDNGGIGISMNGDANTTIASCHVHDNTGDGIDIVATANTDILIVGNHIYDNGPYGIDIAAGAATNDIHLIGNLVTGHATADINNLNATTVRSVESAGNPAQGDVLYHSGTAWTRLAAGTSGEFLKTNGAAANPEWADVASSVFPEYLFQSDQMESPNSSDWAVNALAPLIPDATNTALSVRAFDDTTVEGIGFTVRVPDDATNIILGFLGRAATAPGATATVGLNLYKRAVPDNAAIPAWGSSTALTDLSIPTNANYQKDSQTIAISTLGLTAGVTYTFELCRNVPTDTLTGDWLLHSLTVGWS